MKFRIIVAVLTFLMLVAPIAGCVSQQVASSSPTHTHATPAALERTAAGLDKLIMLSVVVLALSVGAYFIAPEAHQLSISVGTGAASLLGLSFILRVSLWLIPWIAVALGCASLVALVYEIIMTMRAKKESVASAALDVADETAGVITQAAANVATISGMIAVKQTAATTPTK